MMRNRQRIRSTAGGFLLAGCAAVIGCGQDDYDGPPRHPVSGTVTFEGKPLPKGFISFDPDTSKGARGPGTMAQIVDGEYSTPEGRGVVDGPNVARVIGFDGKPIPASEDGTPLFTEQQIPVDLPADKAVYDVDIPAGGSQ